MFFGSGHRGNQHLNSCIRFFLVSLALAQAVWAHSDLIRTMPLEQWIPQQEKIALKNLLRNIAPPGTAPGAVIASPSKENPNYWFHWVRDAALVMDLVVDQYALSSSADQKAYYLNLLWNYADFSRMNQLTPNPSGGPGEPKFHVDGSAFVGPWGRPQNDGPALRAITLIHFAKALIQNSKTEESRRLSNTIKYDLEYVSHHWKHPSFDLWEEIHGMHFYTLIVQYQSMMEGAEYLDLLGDAGAAEWYRQQAHMLETELNKHWESPKGYIVSTRNRVGGIDYKGSNLDASVILGVLHASTLKTFSVEDSRVAATLLKAKQTFKSLYAINQSGPKGIAIGRYPEDKYDGYSSAGEGNPWILITNGFAEFHFRLARRLEKRGVLMIDRWNQPFFRDLGLDLPVGVIQKGESRFSAVLQALRTEGDEYLTRVKYHIDSDGQMAEQMNRWSGYLQGARDLTWSYASFLTALEARSKVP